MKKATFYLVALMPAYVGYMTGNGILSLILFVFISVVLSLFTIDSEELTEDDRNTINVMWFEIVVGIMFTIWYFSKG